VGDELGSDTFNKHLTTSIEWRFTVVTLVTFLAASNSAVGQWTGRQTGCYANSIAANPNRPTVTNPAHVTQYGVLELEYGWDRFWPWLVWQLIPTRGKRRSSRNPRRGVSPLCLTGADIVRDGVTSGGVHCVLSTCREDVQLREAGAVATAACLKIFQPEIYSGTNMVAP
jgi:hypothetical protein